MSKGYDYGEPNQYFEKMHEHIPSHTSLESFDFERVKKSSLKRTYSFSSDINAYEICPLQYMFHKELGYGNVRNGATLFGSVVHQTIEDINKAAIKGDIASITNDNIENWFNENYKACSRLNNYYLSEPQKDAALNQIINYKNKTYDNLVNVVEAEFPVSISNENYDIRGRVDMIAKNGNSYEIVDFKTEKKPDINHEKEKLERVKSQLEVYSNLIEEKYNIKIDDMKVYYTSELSESPVVSFGKNDKSIETTMARFDNIADRIDKKDFIHKCHDAKTCKNCDFRFYCKK